MRQNKDLITIGLMGGSNFERRNLIATLFADYSDILDAKISGDKSKEFVVEFVPCAEREVFSCDLEVNIAQITGGYNREKYNEMVRNSDVLKYLGFCVIEEEEGWLRTVNLFLETVKKWDVKSLLELQYLEGVGEFIKKMVLYGKQSDAICIKRFNPDVSNILTDGDDIGICIRDVDKILDWAKENSNRKIPSPHDLGLDGLDFLLFVCSERYGYTLCTPYKELVAYIMNSVPVFLLLHDLGTYGLNGVVVRDEIKSMPIRTEMLAFQTLQFLKKMNANETEETSVFEERVEVLGIEKFETISEMAFCVPVFPFFMKLEKGEIWDTDDEKDFANFIKVVTSVVAKMCVCVTEYWSRVENVWTAKLAEQLRGEEMYFANFVEKVFVGYANKSSSVVVKRNFAFDFSQGDELYHWLLSNALLGKQDGLTNVRKGRYQHIGTVLVSTILFDTLCWYINNRKYQAEIKTEVAKRLLNNILYTRFQDSGAMIRNDYCLDRYIVVSLVDLLKKNEIKLEITTDKMDVCMLREFAKMIWKQFCDAVCDMGSDNVKETIKWVNVDMLTRKEEILCNQ